LANRYYDGPKTDHFDGARFFHPGLLSSDKSLLDVLKWKITATRSPWPEAIPARAGLHPEKRVEGLRVIAIGHSSLLLQVAGANILIDPVWSDRVSPFRWLGPRRRNAPAIPFENLPHIDCILLTHNHYDHMDVGTLKRLWEVHHPRIFAPLGNDAVIQASAPSVEVKTGDWWDSLALSNALRATLVPAYHWSSRNIRDRRMALWGGFILESPVGVIYCAGDTALRDAAIFHQIRERFGPAHLAIVPIGAYAPRWFMQTQHVDPEEAMQIAQICGAEHVLGVHWGTFQLTDEPYDEPETRFLAAARSQLGANSNVFALHPGDVWPPQGGGL